MLKITIVAVGQKMPAWVNQAVFEYQKRLQVGVLVSFLEIPLQTRGKNADLSRILNKETQMMTQSIPNGAYVIALDSQGTLFTSEKLAENLDKLKQTKNHLCFLIGGPEGLSSTLLQHASEKWSLSKLTLPHPLVRIVLIEALYRSWSILNNHPYHK